MIDVQHRTKRYGPAAAVDDLGCTAAPGAVTAFLGPNGAGKSTTLRILLGLTRADSGTALVGGARYRELRDPLRRVGAVLETAAPHRGLRAADHLGWLARSNGIPRRRVGEVLADVGLAEVARHRIGTFSLGMTQRLGLAGALLGDPGVLVLDEPVNGLDAPGVRWLRDLLRRMAAEGRTVLVSSHLMAEVALVADHLVVVDRGRLLASCGTGEFLRRGRAHVRVRTARPAPLAQALERAGAGVTAAGDGTLRVTGMAAGEVSRVAAAVGAPLEELAGCTASLEDTFLDLVGTDGTGRS